MADAQIIAVVSGKGGVGKTMLSVALANELSLGGKTILLDLDFFNRGLTGLLASLQPSLPKRQVKALELIDKGSEQNWSLAEVHKNLFMIYYDDLGKSEVDVVERHNKELLAKTLRSYVEYLVQITGAAFVVMDCHGGPDNMSFAACIIASRAILVSEPDRITLHGTLNFLRNLKRQIPDASLDIRLIFNKVVAAFSPMFLFRFHDQYLRAEFGGADLLGIFPLEIHLTKEFEKTPFLTTGYPYSQLAIKTRLALFEMFAGEPGITLPPRVASMTKSERWIAKYYMGRWPRILNLDFALKAIAIIALLGFGVPSLIEVVAGPIKETSSLITRILSGLPEVAGVILLFAVIWVILLAALSWTKELDVFVTYSFRKRSNIIAVGASVVLLAILGFIAVILGILGAQIWRQSREVGYWIISFALIGLPSIIFVALYALRGFRNITVDRCYGEGGFRIGFAIFVLAIFAWWSVSFKSL